MPNARVFTSSRFTPPQYAIDFLKKKQIVETEDWHDLSSHEHAHAFTVAHSMNAGILNDTLGLLIEARERGVGYKEFKSAFRARMNKKGWYGKGAGKRGSEAYMNWRTRLIYGVNMRTSRAAGAYRRQLQSAEVRPYLVYKSMLHGGNRRDAHKQMHNVALPVEHEFWKEHYPPNGWGCQCYVISARDEEIESRGYRRNDGIAISSVANSTPAEWKQNAGFEAMAPRFGAMRYIQRYPELMKRIVRAYADDMRDIALTRYEFSALAQKLADYGDARIKPNVPVLVGALREDVWDAVNRVVPEIDVKLNASTADIMHALRIGKVHRVPNEKLHAVWDVMQSPDVVYREKSELLFFGEVGNEEYIRVAFGHKKNVLQLRSFSYLGGVNEQEKIKGMEILYEKGR